MTVYELIETLEREKYRFSLCGEKVTIRPTPPMEKLIHLREMKGKLLAILHEREESCRVFTSALEVIAMFPEDDTDRSELIREYEASPDDRFPLRLAVCLVEIFRRRFEGVRVLRAA